MARSSPVKRLAMKVGEVRARLGAKPSPLRVWIRHRVPAVNLLLRSLLRLVPHDEAPERNPFREEPQRSRLP